MAERLKRFFRQGAIRIPRQKERAIYFYATVALFILYLVHQFKGGG